jgi:hypothetical protein
MSAVQTCFRVPIWGNRDSCDTRASRADTTAGATAPIVGSSANERAAPGMHPSDSLLSQYSLLLVACLDAAVEDGDGASESAPAGADNVAGTRKRKPDAMLEHFVAVLSTEQKQQLLGLLGGPTAVEPIKTSRGKAASGESAVKLPPKKKAKRESADVPAKRASAATAITPAASTMEGNDEQRDSGRAQSDFDLTVCKDTTGVYRVAYNWPPTVQKLMVDWIMGCGRPSYYKPLERMWEAKSEPWTIGVPCPPAAQVHAWVRVERTARLQQAGGHPPLTKQVMQQYNAVSMRVVQEKMGASPDPHTKEQLQLQASFPAACATAHSGNGPFLQ